MATRPTNSPDGLEVEVSSLVTRVIGIVAVTAVVVLLILF